jgi:predicted ribosomally synthesized peptide with SipW-like signal peptide
MKKIALASAAMGGVALFAFGASGTFASFTDSEVATATAKAGSMDLKVGGATATSGASLDGLNPGDSTTVSYWINNAGTVAGDLSAKLTVTDAENGCTDPESKTSGENCSQWTTGGELSQFATVQFLDATAADDEACKKATNGAAVLGMQPVVLKDAVVASQIPVGALAKNEGNCVVLKITVPDTAGNIVQGDTADVKMDITLAQKKSV